MIKKLVICLCIGLFTSPVFAAAERYTLDPTHATVAFLIDHVGYAKTLGSFTDVAGSFSYDADSGQITDVSIVVQTASVNTAHEARDKHVKSKDFLSVKKHPEMIFTASSAILNADGQVNLEGNLQLLGQSQPLVLTATLNKSEKYPFGHKSFTLGVSARGSLQRSAYGMSYGVANALVGDAIELIIEVEANQDK